MVRRGFLAVALGGGVIAGVALALTGARLERVGEGAARAADVEPPPAAPTPTMTEARRRREAAHRPAAVATFAGGCFWGVEEAFRHVPGVTDTAAGYTGGTVAHPTYRQVAAGRTGHAEAVRVTYDPAQVGYGDLLTAFFAAHDPTWDGGPRSRYRSAVFFHTPEQRRAAERAISHLHPASRRPVTTAVAAAGTFWPAEAHHQQYLARHPGAAAACGL
jgi:peptide-methionine (S)-S-oxide reductase